LRVAYLGPTGTFTEEALLEAAEGAAVELDPRATIVEAVGAVEAGEAERAFVPFENSVEGSVRSTLDALAFETARVRIAGEFDHQIHHNLIARARLDLGEVRLVVSHPQANAQCGRFVRSELPDAAVRSAASTADAVRQVAEGPDGWAALGSAAAARAYGCVILRAGVEDEADNVTRFVWLSDGDGGGERGGGELAWRTTLVFSELGDDHPGALVEALTEFSSRGINLTRIESRPLRRGLGRYQFFIDLEGRAGEAVTDEGIDALRAKAENVRVIGSYPIGGPAPL
jgi:prephenate dehydratase